MISFETFVITHCSGKRVCAIDVEAPYELVGQFLTCSILSPKSKLVAELRSAKNTSAFAGGLNSFEVSIASNSVTVHDLDSDAQTTIESTDFFKLLDAWLSFLGGKKEEKKGQEQ